MLEGSSSVIEKNLRAIRSRIEQAAARCGRTGDEVSLVAVSKKMPVAVMQEAVAAGQLLFGESYVQEAAGKRSELDDHVRLDLIGHLQRNKVKQAVGCFSLIHSVDSLELAERISAAAVRRELIQDVLMQVNVSREAQKSGIDPASAESLCRSMAELPGLRLQGLMIIGRWMPQGVDEEERREEFVRTRLLRDELEQTVGAALPQLSMGMSGDYEMAVEEGATLVRVGSALFGERS